MGQVCITERSWIQEERSVDEWNGDWRCVGWHEDCERMCCTSVRSFSLESSKRVNANLDTGAAVNTFPASFDREELGDRSFHDWIPVRQFQGLDENCKPTSLNGRVTDAHQVLVAMLQHLQQHRQLLMCTKYGAVLTRSRTKKNKTSMRDTMVVT